MLGIYNNKLTCLHKSFSYHIVSCDFFLFLFCNCQTVNIVIVLPRFMILEQRVPSFTMTARIGILLLQKRFIALFLWFWLAQQT
jgi:hypothetical protein